MIAALLAAVAGVALQLQQAVLWSPRTYLALLASGAVCTGLALYRRGKPDPWWRDGLAGLAAAALLAGVTGLRAHDRLERLLPAALDGQDLLLVGHVSGLPRIGERGVQFEFEPESAHWNGRPVVPPARVQLGWWQGEADGELLDPGQRWELVARLQRPHGLANPQGLDVELWLWEQDLQATGSVRIGRKFPRPRLLLGQVSEPVARARAMVRTAIRQAVPDARAAGVLAALVVGDQAAIDSADWDVFRLTGVAHLVSISGLHVTMFAVLAAALVGRFWRLLAWGWPGLLLRWPAPRVAAVGGVLLALAYSIFSGWGVPAQRTVLMLGLLTGLRLVGLRWPWPVLLLFTMVAVLLLDPWALLQAGFWLSFVAVGVLLASSWLGQSEPGGMRAWWLGLLRTQLIVSVALAPLTLLCFGQFSVVGLLANLAAVPWVSAVITPLAMLGVICAPLWRLGAWCVQLMNSVLQWLAALRWAAIERPDLPLLLALATLLGGVLLVLRLPWRSRCWGVLLLWPLLVWGPHRPAQGEFELVAPDVGQGSAVVVRTARHTLVHDAGPGQGSASAAQRVLLPLLRAGGDRLDIVVASHDDLDHVGGLPELLRRHPHAELWASYDTRRSTGRHARACQAGQGWSWDGVGFEWLNPRAGDVAAGLPDNALSCVLRITSAAGRIALLTGDIGVREEERLLGEQAGLRADLLLAPHHGSSTSSGAAWLDALQPGRVLIQSGHLNRFGHPAPEVLQRLRERRIPWVASPDCGAATWHSQSPEDMDCWRLSRRRYWQTSVMAGRN